MDFSQTLQPLDAALKTLQIERLSELSKESQIGAAVALVLLRNAHDVLELLTHSTIDVPS